MLQLTQGEFPGSEASTEHVEGNHLIDAAHREEGEEAEQEEDESSTPPAHQTNWIDAHQQTLEELEKLQRSIEAQPSTTVNEEVCESKYEEPVYEAFNLPVKKNFYFTIFFQYLHCINNKIIYEKNRTGLEANKDFPIILHSVIAGRFQILEHLGSAAFSNAIRCLDLEKNIEVTYSFFYSKILDSPKNKF